MKRFVKWHDMCNQNAYYFSKMITILFFDGTTENHANHLVRSVHVSQQVSVYYFFVYDCVS